MINNYFKALVIFSLSLLAYEAKALKIDTIEVIYAHSNGNARRIMLIIEGGISTTCSFDEFNFNSVPIIDGYVLSRLSIDEQWSFYQNHSYQRIADKLSVTDQERLAFLEILESIKLSKNVDQSEIVVSSAWNSYLIKTGKSIAYVEDMNGKQWGPEMENALNLKSKAFFIRLKATETPSLYSLDGLRVPYETIKLFLVNDDVIEFSFDKSFITDYFHGLYHVQTNLPVMVDGKMLTTRREKRKYLSRLDFREIKISRLKGEDARIQYGEKTKKDVLLISRL